jgi:membrane-associated protein
VQHVEAALPPVPGGDVPEGERLRVPHVQVAGGVREHVEDVLPRAGVRGVVRAEEVALPPHGLPLLLQLLEGRQLVGASLGHHGSFVLRRGTAFNPRGPRHGRSPPAYAWATTTKERHLDAWLTALLEGLAGLGAWRYVAAFIGMFCETSLFIGLIVPGDTIVLFTATAGRGAVEWVLLVLAVVAGSLAGETVGFVIGRFFGPRLRMSRLGRRIGEPHVLRAERWLDRRGGVAIALSRFLPIMHALIPVTVGASTYPYRRFLAWTAPACVVWAALYVSVGQAAGSSYRALARELHFAGWIVLAGIAVFLLAVWLGKRLLHRLERH